MKKAVFLFSIFFFVFLSCHREEPLEPPFGERCVSSVTDRDYTPFLLGCFEGSNKYIHIIMYLMKYYPADPLSGVSQLQTELINAHHRGVDVKVLLEKSDYNSSLNASNESTMVYLSANGIDVRCDGLGITTHAKCIVIDGRTAVVGSSNWTNSALDENNEVNVKISDQITVSEFESYFNELWEDSEERLK